MVVTQVAGDDWQGRTLSVIVTVEKLSEDHGNDGRRNNHLCFAMAMVWHDDKTIYHRIAQVEWAVVDDGARAVL